MTLVDEPDYQNTEANSRVGDRVYSLASPQKISPGQRSISDELDYQNLEAKCRWGDEA